MSVVTHIEPETLAYLTFATPFTTSVRVTTRHETEPLLGRVRVARGLTQNALAKQAGISQALLSKAESGLVELDPERAKSVAGALDVPQSALTVPVSALSSSNVFHRKRATMPTSKANQVRAILDLTQLQVGAILANRRPPRRIESTPLPEDGYTTPEDIAKSLRKRIAPGVGPVQSVVATLESAGVPVVMRDLESSLIEEAEADRFASEFLMSARGIREDLATVSIPSLARLKPIWRVSKAALLRRARDLGQITESRSKSLSIEMSAAGYRKNEPVSISAEGPALIGAVLGERLAAGHTIESLAADAHMTTEEFQTTYGGMLR